MSYQPSHVLAKFAARCGIITGAAALAAATAGPLAVPAANAATVTYTARYNGTEGVIQNALSGKYLNVAASGSYATGDKLIQYGSGGASHEKFRIVIITGSDGSQTGYLEAISPNGAGFYVFANGEGQLTLGGEAPATLTEAAADATLIAKGPADMLKSGPYYTFPTDRDSDNQALVMDDSGQSTANGAHVIAYPKNNGENQQWSLP